MKFLFGSQNFGLDTPESDKDYIEFVYPKLGDLCKPIPSAKEQKQEDGSIIKKVDVRSIPSLFYKSNLDTLQLLYSKQVVKGAEIQKLFRSFEHEMSTINIPRLYQSVMGSTINRFKKGTAKDLAHVVFGFKLLKQFHDQGFKDLAASFNHDDHKLYQDIRSGILSYDGALTYAKELEMDCLELKESYMSQKPNDRLKRILENIVGSLILLHLQNEEE